MGDIQQFFSKQLVVICVGEEHLVFSCIPPFRSLWSINDYEKPHRTSETFWPCIVFVPWWWSSGGRVGKKGAKVTIPAPLPALEEKEPEDEGMLFKREERDSWESLTPAGRKGGRQGERRGTSSGPKKLPIDLAICSCTWDQRLTSGFQSSTDPESSSAFSTSQLCPFGQIT